MNILHIIYTCIYKYSYPHLFIIITHSLDKQTAYIKITYFDTSVSNIYPNLININEYFLDEHLN
jgi:hypothetical protein